MTVDRRVLVPTGLTGGLVREDGATPLAGAAWYRAEAAGAALSFAVEAGSLAATPWLAADLLVDGHELVVFELALQEGEGGRRFVLMFSALNQCAARMRIDLANAVTQNRWRYEREAAFLKPMCGGDRVDLARVDRLALSVLRKSDRPARFCVTPLEASVAEPARMGKPLLPQGPLLDELGQSRLSDWAGRSKDEAEVVGRMRAQRAAAASPEAIPGRSRWGGWTGKRIQPSGYFRMHHDGRRWWLVDPDGHPFWSTGMDCVRVDTDAAYAGLTDALTWLPESQGKFGAALGGSDGQPSVNYLAANLIRAFGPDRWKEDWAAIALGELTRLGFNTVANWSDWTIAQAASFPYVRPLHPSFKHAPLVFRDFPDVFDPGFDRDAAEFARQLAVTAKDPALIGYFLMNEPTWGFAAQCPALGMLQNTVQCEARRQLAEWLRERHGSDAGLAAAWGAPVTVGAVARGPWSAAATPAMVKDLETFSEIMVDRFFGTLTEACRKVDPVHMNLGARYYTVPPWWAIKGMKWFDVFSVNGYEHKVRRELAELSKALAMPVLVGEWHFGALDAGLPGSGIGHVRTQADRGKAYRVYLEDAAAQPWCVGVHWFTLYDESALGRFDGENWQIGFYDVCHRPYEPLCAAARLAHEAVYRVALGEVPPYADEPEYLPKLFL